MRWDDLGPNDRVELEYEYDGECLTKTSTPDTFASVPSRSRSRQCGCNLASAPPSRAQGYEGRANFSPQILFSREFLRRIAA